MVTKMSQSGVIKLVMDLDQNFLTRAGWDHFFVAWVGSSRPPLGLEISTKTPKIFNFFHFGSKKIPLGWVKKYLSQRQFRLLFTAGQKYARVGSGAITCPDLTQPKHTFDLQ